MSISSGRLEEEILILERQIWQLPDWHALGVRLVALEQQLAASWGGAGFPPAVTGPPPPNSTITGTVKGCGTSGLSGQSVTVTVTSTGATLFTATTNSSGVYTGTVYLASSTGITVTVTPSSTNFVTTSATATATAGGTTTVNVTETTASGYECVSFCLSPVKTILSLHDTLLARDYTMTWNGTSWVDNPTAASYILATNTVLTLVGPGAHLSPQPGSTCSPLSLNYQSSTVLGAYPAGSTWIITQP